MQCAPLERKTFPRQSPSNDDTLSALTEEVTPTNIKANIKPKIIVNFSSFFSSNFAGLITPLITGDNKREKVTGGVKIISWAGKNMLEFVH